LNRLSSKGWSACRERAAGYYTELSWAFAEVLVEIPYLLIQASLYSLITYFMIWFEINAGGRWFRSSQQFSQRSRLHLSLQ